MDRDGEATSSSASIPALEMWMQLAEYRRKAEAYREYV
jgi:hypothetical protein